MNSSSPVATGAAALSGGSIGEVISWLCTAVHIPAPPENVAMALGAVILAIGHALYVKYLAASEPVAAVSEPEKASAPTPSFAEARHQAAVAELAAVHTAP
jgi:hypothetical protein